jgi:Mrp family chromosome partitioning ATPase
MVLPSLRRYAVPAALLMLAAIAGGIYAQSSRPTEYRATASVTFLPSGSRVASGPLFGAGLPTLLGTYAHITSGKDFLATVQESTGESAQTLKQSLIVSPHSSAAVLDVSATAPHPDTAAAIANAAAAALVEVITNQQNDAKSTLVHAFATDAAVPGQPTGPPRYVVLAGIVLAGALIAAIAAVLADVFYGRISDPEALKDMTTIQVFGVLPKTEPPQPGPVLAVGVPGADQLLASAALQLRTNMYFRGIRAHRWSSVAIIGLEPMAGTTTTVLNVAAGLAKLESRIVVVDAAPDQSVERFFPSQDNSNVFVQRVASRQRDLARSIGAAARRPDDLVLVNGPPLADDLVLVDGPPLSTSPSAQIIANRVDAVVLVVPADSSRRNHVRRTIDSLEALGVPIGGIVLTRASRRATRRWTTTISDEEPLSPAVETRADGVQTGHGLAS